MELKILISFRSFSNGFRTSIECSHHVHPTPPHSGLSGYPLPTSTQENQGCKISLLSETETNNDDKSIFAGSNFCIFCVIRKIFPQKLIPQKFTPLLKL